MRTRFLGTIATTRTDISPIQALKDLWGGEWPEFDDMDAFNALLQDLTSLWNDLAGGQSRTKPFRLARLSVKPDPDELQRLCRTRVEEIEGFVEELFGDEESVDVPESASEALDHLAEINASMHGCLDLMQQVPAPTGSEETLADGQAPEGAVPHRRERTHGQASRLAPDLSEASGIGRVDGGFRGGFSLRVGD